LHSDGITYVEDMMFWLSVYYFLKWDPKTIW